MSEAATLDAALPAQPEVMSRVRRFAVLRAAQRALDPSSPAPMALADLEALRWIRERLRRLAEACEPPAAGSAGSTDDLIELDRALDGYARLLLSRLESLPISQLRASLRAQTRQERTEVMALLELCLESEPAPARYLHVVDLLITLLCVSRRDGRWQLETDPSNLNDTIRRRCWAVTPCGTEVETAIAGRFQRAAERLARDEESATILAEVSAYKGQIARFFFDPAVLRCIVSYNAAARNHFEERLRRSRELDTAIDDEIGLFEPLAVEGDAGAGLPPDDSPGVLAVQEAIRRRLAGADNVEGPAARIASELDLSWLEGFEREALLRSERDGISRIVRTTVVLGHLALVLPERPGDFAALGLDERHLDAWICSLGEEVQREINGLIQESSYDGAQRLGDTKSRFLAAVLLVARRRSQSGQKRRAATAEPDTFRRDAIALVREHLERMRLRRRRAAFADLFGGGWRRSVGMAAVLALVALVWLAPRLQPADPRAIHQLSGRQARDVSPFLASAYRDRASGGSIFVGTLSADWETLEPERRREVAERIRGKLLMDGVQELLLFDRDRVLQAHYAPDGWRSDRAWAEGLPRG